MNKRTKVSLVLKSLALVGVVAAATHTIVSIAAVHNAMPHASDILNLTKQADTNTSA